MPKVVANVLGAIACIYMMSFIVIFCFPYSYVLGQLVKPKMQLDLHMNNRLPVNSSTLQTSMNWTSVVTGGLTLIPALFYPWQRRNGLTSPADAARGLSVIDAVEADK